MTSEKHEVLEAELRTVHASVERLVGVLISAKRKCEEEEGHSNPSEKKIGKFRVEIAGNERKLVDLQQLWCERAQEELACRYLEVEQRVEEERGAREGMALQELSVTGQLAAIQEKITAFDCAPSWQLSRLTQQVKKTVSGPLRRALEVKLAAGQQAHQAALDQASELESQLETVRSQLSDSGTQEVVLRAELEKLLVQGESHHRVVQGSPAEIRAALRADRHITVDRWAAEELLQQWEKGFTEVLDQSYNLEPDQVVTFVVEEAVIAFWFDTGKVAGSEILWAASGTATWSKSHRGLPLALTQKTLEAKRAAQERQMVSV